MLGREAAREVESSIGRTRPTALVGTPEDLDHMSLTQIARG